MSIFTGFAMAATCGDNPAAQRLQACLSALAPQKIGFVATTAVAAPAAAAASPPPHIAVVTGANKGVGKEIVRQLAASPGWLVVACARDPAKGEAAVADLIREGSNPSQLQFQPLDIDDQASIDSFAAWFDLAHGRVGLSTLVNNAAIQIEAGAPGNPSFAEQAASTLHTNFFQTISLTAALRPFLRADGRLVFVSSMAGTGAFETCSPAMQARVKACASATQLRVLGREFVRIAEAEGAVGVSSAGFAPTTYGTSKMLLIAYARSLSKYYAGDSTRYNVRVNACCPGFCRTDMTVREGGITGTGADMS